MHHTNVVRDFKTVNADKTSNGNVDLILPEGLWVKDCKVIAYLQNGDSWRVISAVETTIQ